MTYSTVSWKALLVSAALTLPGLAFAAEPAMTHDGMLAVSYTHLRAHET